MMGLAEPAVVTAYATLAVAVFTGVMAAATVMILWKASSEEWVFSMSKAAMDFLAYRARKSIDRLERELARERAKNAGDPATDSVSTIPGWADRDELRAVYDAVRNGMLVVIPLPEWKELSEDRKDSIREHLRARKEKS